MSDRFDPNAWPYPDDDGDEKARKDAPANGARTDDQDDFRSLDFDNPSKPADRGYGDPYSDAPYSDTAYDDYSYGNAGGAHGAHSMANDSYDYGDAPSAGFGGRVDGQAQGQDDFGYSPARANGSTDDDDYGTVPAGTNTGGADREPYGSADEGYGYDENDTERANASHRSSGSYDDDDPYGSSPEDRDYDDDDDYDDYDREPEKNHGGLARKLLGAAAVIVILIAGVLAFLTFTGGDDQTATQPDDTQQAAPSAPSGNATTETVLPTAAPVEVTAALNNALAAWGRYAVNGDLSQLQPYFATGGAQYKSFEAEATSIRDAPPGGNALTMQINNPVTGKVNDTNWIVRGQVSVTRGTDPTQTFPWQFRMVNDAGNWKVTSVTRYQ